MVIPRETKKRLSTLYAKTYRQMLPSYFENVYRRDSVHKATKRRTADQFCRYDSSGAALCKLRRERSVAVEGGKAKGKIVLEGFGYYSKRDVAPAGAIHLRIRLVVLLANKR
jgi:hypothetical protein